MEKVGILKADTCLTFVVSDNRFIKVTFAAGTPFAVDGSKAVVYARSLDLVEVEKRGSELVVTGWKTVSLRKFSVVYYDGEYYIELNGSRYKLHFANPEAPRKVPPLCFLNSS
ncbi:MAG: hypothetical protein QXL06_01880 [Nitrososphaerota archaeon]